MVLLYVKFGQKRPGLEAHQKSTCFWYLDGSDGDMAEVKWGVRNSRQHKQGSGQFWTGMEKWAQWACWPQLEEALARRGVWCTDEGP
jgi:hypothetical protein